MKKFIKKSVYIIIFTTLLSWFSFGTAFAEISTSTLVDLTNNSRAQNNLSSLTVNSRLQAAAEAKAQDMLKNQYFSHTSPAGKSPWDFINEANYNYVYAGENLAIGYTNNNDLHNAWMNSPSHRENILSPNFREIGIGQISGSFEGAETVIVVQMFGSTEIAAPTRPNNNESNNNLNFNINDTESKVTPNKIFSGDQIELKAVITGEINSVYFKIGEHKIDLTDSKVSANNNTTIYDKKVNFNDNGTLPIILTATDKAGNSKSKGLGNLVVQPKILAGLGAYRDQKSELVTIGLVVAGIFVIGFAAGGVYIVVRRRHNLKPKLI